MQQAPIIPQSGPRLPDTDGPYVGNTPKHEGARNIVSTIAILLAAPLIALLLTTFVFQSYEVDGPSMETTLQNKDRLIVLKTGKTWSTLLRNKYVPKRGEIVIFHKKGSADFGSETDRQLIKRVIGVPGDHVVIKNGSIRIYNDEFPKGFNPDETGGYKDTVDTTTTGNVDLTVPDGEIFVCGDNRNNSLDSRSFGTVASDELVGVLALRIYPFSKFDSF